MEDLKNLLYEEILLWHFPEKKRIYQESKVKFESQIINEAPLETQQYDEKEDSSGEDDLN
jgi:hypothetical protein